MSHLPLTVNDLKAIGHIVKTFGYAGEYIFSSDYDDAIERLEYVFIEIDGLPVPYALAKVRYQKNDLWCIGFNPIPEDESYVGKTVYAKSDDLKQAISEDDDDRDSDCLFYDDLIGYDIIDASTDKRIGTIIGIDDSTENALFVVESDESDDSAILIPIANEFIDYIEDKRIGMTLPQGLLDL